MSKYNWPLAINNFDLFDRLKICYFFLNFNNRWTQDKYVKEYEKKVAEFVGCKYALFVSSGSAANQLIAQYVKDVVVGEEAFKAGKNKVLVNAVTWQTNVSPWIREGFDPVFIDVNLNDFCMDYEKLFLYLVEHEKRVAAVFPTSVLGYAPNIATLNLMQSMYPNVFWSLDCCENFLSKSASDWNDTTNKENVCKFYTSSTSTYVAHQISNGQEGGFIFTNSQEEYKYFLLARAHGLARNLIPYGELDVKKNLNALVDPQFDFQVISSNYRNTDIGAFLGLLDFKKIEKNTKHRKEISELFFSLLDKDKYLNPNLNEPYADHKENVAFCLPIIIKEKNTKARKERIESVKSYLDSKKIERRSFISGNMLRQKPYQKYGDYKKFKNAEYLNNYAIYIGLHANVTKQSIKNLCFDLNLL